jgi:hypothetical protein
MDQRVHKNIHQRISRDIQDQDGDEDKKRGTRKNAGPDKQGEGGELETNTTSGCCHTRQSDHLRQSLTKVQFPKGDLKGAAADSINNQLKLKLKAFLDLYTNLMKNSKMVAFYVQIVDFGA